MRYQVRERQPASYEAAWYTTGGPLGELLAVVQAGDEFAVVHEVPELLLALVRWADSESGEFEYRVVEDGSWLIWDDGLRTAFTLGDDEFLAAFVVP